MSHTCSHALVRCIDFRLGPAIRDYLNENDLYGNTDIISLAGAAKDIAQTDDSFAEGQVSLSNKLHETNTVILMNHTDCGGYGGSAAFSSKEDERTKHIEDMNAAKTKINATHPNLNVKLALAVISEDGSVQIEEIA
jgi:carbonic anhydrase